MDANRIPTEKIPSPAVASELTNAELETAVGGHSGFAADLVRATVLLAVPQD